MKKLSASRTMKIINFTETAEALEEDTFNTEDELPEDIRMRKIENKILKWEKTKREIKQMATMIAKRFDKRGDLNDSDTLDEKVDKKAHDDKKRITMHDIMVKPYKIKQLLKNQKASP
jgi:hypothetical protein